MTDEKLVRALAAAARAFADSLTSGDAVNGSAPEKGSAESMAHVLREVAAINDNQHRGVDRKEMAAIAKAAGMDPRGMAGYYTSASKLLEKRADKTRWITKQGRQRLKVITS